MNKDFLERMYKAVREDTENWNRRMKNPAEKARSGELEDKISKEAYLLSKELTKPGYVDQSKRYVG